MKHAGFVFLPGEAGDVFLPCLRPDVSVWHAMSPLHSYHVHVYVYICVCVYIYIYTHTHTYIYVYVYIEREMYVVCNCSRIRDTRFETLRLEFARTDRAPPPRRAWMDSRDSHVPIYYPGERSQGNAAILLTICYPRERSQGNAAKGRKLLNISLFNYFVLFLLIIFYDFFWILSLLSLLLLL